MSKVLFTFNSGRQRLASPRDAELLRRIGQGSYETRDMADQLVMTKVSAPPASPADEDSIAPEAPAIVAESDGLDELDAEALHALAKERGVKVHYKAGADKVRAALREAAK